MADKSYPMTAEGKKKLENELEELKTKKRPEVIERIKVARGFGDLSENSEYEAAKDEQSTLENRIVTIQTMLRYAEIIDAKAVAKNEVSIGKKVTFEEDGDEETYEI
ncbi:transcription elongation factor GreA, partial [Lacticaseibacillus rhamnosus]|nr:transcription elongation factor GreA [Lacticaseibacillus rhamnosus]